MKKITLLTFLLTISFQLIAQNTFHIFNAKGKIKSTLKADLIEKGAGDYFIIYSEGKCGIYNYKEQKIMTEIVYRDLSIDKNGLAIAKNKHEKWGIVDAKKVESSKIVLPFDYFKIIQLDPRYYSVMTFNRKWGVYDVVQNRFTLDCDYDIQIVLQDEVFVIRQKGLYGMYGKNGKIVMPFQKQILMRDKDNHLVNIRRNNVTLLFNTQTLEYQSELDFEEFPVKFVNDFAKIGKKGKYGFLSISGEMITDFEYDKIKSFNKSGFAGVQKDEKWGVINDFGELVLELNFLGDSAPEVYQNGLYIKPDIDTTLLGIKQLDGTWRIKPEFNAFQFFQNHIVGTKENQSYVFDYDGNLVHKMPPNQTIKPFGTFFSFSENGDYGWMSPRFKIKGEIGTGDLQGFNFNKILLVSNNSMFGVVTKKGKRIIPTQYHHIDIYEAEHKIIFVHTMNQLSGAYNLRGKQIIEPKYKELVILDDGWSVMMEEK